MTSWSASSSTGDWSGHCRSLGPHVPSHRVPEVPDIGSLTSGALTSGGRPAPVSAADATHLSTGGADPDRPIHEHTGTDVLHSAHEVPRCAEAYVHCSVMPRESSRYDTKRVRSTI